MGKLTYVVIIISVIVIVSLFWINFPSIFPPSIKEMRNTFSASVTTPTVNVNGINSTTFSLSFSIKVSIPDYSGRVFLASGVIPLGANPLVISLSPSYQTLHRQQYIAVFPLKLSG
ncbi:hypothetical protein [Sulfurisphaera ohwakuensis]|uniref:Uncharacterized protein n=2 Tax=Sulfurisphaera ohwakuensis TaxID=69656 RepID=A0A7J9RTS0_SULOH|nr:hypothetical protein [Sulfurisphaera ohwakuensis]MBB5254398.1 hypothetical protein [Sulfurisphaera ohwakuensis]